MKKCDPVHCTEAGIEGLNSLHTAHDNLVLNDRTDVFNKLNIKKTSQS